MAWKTLETAVRPIYETPSLKARVMGSLRRGRPFPIFAEESASGCKKPWVRVGKEGWICSVAIADAQKPKPTTDLEPSMPFEYVTVYQDTEIFREPRRNAGTQRIRKRKSSMTVLEKKGKWTKVFPDEWLETRMLIPREMRAYRLQGEEITDGLENPLAFARFRGVTAFEEPGLSRKDQKRTPEDKKIKLNRFDRYPVLEEYPQNTRYGGNWVKLPIGWVERRKVSLVKKTPRPRRVKEGQQWILVDLSEQTIVAYEEDRPVYATMVSTGKDQSKTTPTPKGQWKIQSKLRSTRMAGGSGASYHYLSDVPWVQYFNGGYALHGVYWHNAFGWTQSQGCVNMTPTDAHWFFQWTNPALPEGWHSYAPSPRKARATWVIVRD